MTTFQNPLADPLGTRRGPPLVRGPQFENRWFKVNAFVRKMGLSTRTNKSACTDCARSSCVCVHMDS